MKRKFDCVEMQDKAGEEIYEEIKDMTLEEELAYWREKSRLFAQEPSRPPSKRQTA